MQSRGHVNESSTKSEASTGGDRPGAGPRRLAVTVAVTAAVIAFDQLTKWWAVERLTNDTIDLVWTLRLRLIRNYGGSFGVGQGRGAVIAVIGLVVTAALLVMAWRTKSTAARVAFGFFMGGALGNIIDRVLASEDGWFNGGVVDFIDLQWWPVFNVADVSLFIGVGILLLAGPTESNEAAPDG